MNDEVVVAVSGYFDPMHVGHLEYLQLASKLGDKLIVIVNNNHQAELKKGEFFMHEKDRMEIVAALKCVDEVFLSIDKDKSVSKTIQKIYNELKNEFELFFANGGDQDNSSILESKVCKELNIKMIDGIGSKIQSSSWLLNTNL